MKQKRRVYRRTKTFIYPLFVPAVPKPLEVNAMEDSFDEVLQMDDDDDLDDDWDDDFDDDDDNENSSEEE